MEKFGLEKAELICKIILMENTLLAVSVSFLVAIYVLLAPANFLTRSVFPSSSTFLLLFEFPSARGPSLSTNIASWVCHAC